MNVQPTDRGRLTEEERHSDKLRGEERTAGRLREKQHERRRGLFKRREFFNDIFNNC